jgi:hypothetical protein
MYTSDTNEKKYGTYLMNMIKYICKKIGIKKISLSPIDNDIKIFYIKNNFYPNLNDGLFYYDL